jgi:hypothetical protein
MLQRSDGLQFGFTSGNDAINDRVKDHLLPGDCQLIIGNALATQAGQLNMDGDSTDGVAVDNLRDVHRSQGLQTALKAKVKTSEMTSGRGSHSVHDLITNLPCQGIQLTQEVTVEGAPVLAGLKRSGRQSG